MNLQHHTPTHPGYIGCANKERKMKAAYSVIELETKLALFG